MVTAKKKEKERDNNKTGRPPGIPNPDGIEKIRRQHHNLYDALLRKAQAGDAAAIRLCLELTGEYFLRVRAMPIPLAQFPLSDRGEPPSTKRTQQSAS